MVALVLEYMFLAADKSWEVFRAGGDKSSENYPERRQLHIGQ